MDCLFCRIIAGEIPSRRVLETDRLIAFADISPQAPVHVLIVPKKHYDDITAVDDPQLMEAVRAAASKLAAEYGLAGGFRLVINTGVDGGQSVPHLHVHLLGGRSLEWPPG